MIRLPALEGIVRRRILVSFRVDPDVMARCLPPPFAPQLVDGHALAGLCLIRLEQLRPQGMPAAIGVSSENAAHRVAVTWTDASGAARCGVYISRRDTNSRLNVLAGGRVFPGEHSHARFSVHDDGRSISLTMTSSDGAADVSLRARSGTGLPRSSVFSSVRAASDFFAAGSVGFSPGRDGRADGLRLCTREWHVEPLDVDVAALSAGHYADATRFPRGSVTFDSALIMRDLPHRWQPVALDAELP